MPDTSIARAISVARDSAEISLRAGDDVAVFRHTDAGWMPDWFYHQGEPVLRFKDHEWLSVGHCRSLAQEALVEDGAEEIRVTFRGETTYLTIPVAWSVQISVSAREPFFHLRTELCAPETIELQEAFTAMETPYVYSSAADSVCMIAQNPVTAWKQGQPLARRCYDMSQWMYNREDSARSIIRAQTPLLSFRVVERAGDMPLYLNFVGNWEQSTFHALYMSPVGGVKQKSAFLNDVPRADSERGFKFIIGAHNWSSSLAEDSNILFEGGQRYAQDFYVEINRAPIALDDWFYHGFLKALALHFPADGVVPAFERATAKRARVEDANSWLMDTFNSDGLPGLYDPAQGIVVYTEGTRPRGFEYNSYWFAQWLGPIGYQAWITGEERHQMYTTRHTRDVARIMRADPLLLLHITFLPALYYTNLTRDPELTAACQDVADALMGHVASGDCYQQQPDSGRIAGFAEALLLLARILDAPCFRAAAIGMLRRINVDLDHRFWYYGYSAGVDKATGKQLRPLGMGHAAMANLLEYENSGDAQYVHAAERYAKYLLSMAYSVSSDSPDADLDYRGFANGAISGRDLTADYPPWETAESLRCLSYLLPYCQLEGIYYLLWYQRHTLQGVYPAARELKRFYNVHEQPIYRPVHEVASERHGILRFPFMAYENPFDQTLQAPYQGTDALQHYLAYCGGLAQVADDRLLAVVPRVAGYDPKIKTMRLIHLFNPLAEAISSTLTVRYMEPAAHYAVTIDGQKRLVDAKALINLPVTLAGKAVVEVLVTCDAES